MYDRDYVDIATGLVLALAGVVAAVYCATHYDLGEFSYMGPGMFPTGAGICLAVIGVLVAVPALLRAGPRPQLNLRAAIAVLAGAAVFAALARPFGLVPASLACVIVAALGDPKVGIVQSVVLGILLAALSWVVFVLGLGVTLPAARWPF